MRGCARLLFGLRCSQHEARSCYKCSVSANHSRSIHWFQIPINLLMGAHSTLRCQGQSLWLSVSHAVAETVPAAKEDDFCTVQERRCRAPLTVSSDFFPSHFLTKEDSCLIESSTRLTGSPFFVFAFHFVLIKKTTTKKQNATSFCVSLPQRDAQVARREPQKAFGHQPSAQTAQVPGGGRGHQGGPQVLPLSRGHQQRVHRGADIENHRLLWIPALECELHQ